MCSEYIYTLFCRSSLYFTVHHLILVLQCLFSVYLILAAHKLAKKYAAENNLGFFKLIQIGL